MTDCIFCRIITKEISAEIVYEDDIAIAFLDAHPKALGHTLLIPREHYVWMQDVPDELLAKMFVTAKKLMIELQTKYSADYVQLDVVGKDVPHFHIHLVPQKLS